MKSNNILLNNFLLALKSKGRSQNTITSYEIDNIQLLNYIREIKHIEASIDTFGKEFFNSIEYQDLEFYMNYLTGKNEAESTRARKTTSIKEFYKYLTKTKVIITNPALDLESPKIPERKPVYLDLDESKKLLNSINKKNNHNRNKERDYAILTIFLNCGLRREEMTKINLEHIKGDVLTVIGKGNKERDVILTPACLSAIEKYLEVRPQVDEKALFLSEEKKRISDKSVYTLVKKCLGEAGLDTEKYSPHSLRHAAGSLMYKYGGDIRSIQETLGHGNLNTTKIYVHIDKEQQRKVANSNPLSNIV
jgi:integrase/recombinase XerD